MSWKFKEIRSICTSNAFWPQLDIHWNILSPKSIITVCAAFKYGCFHISFPTLLRLHKGFRKCWMRTVQHSQKPLRPPVESMSVAQLSQRCQKAGALTVQGLAWKPAISQRKYKENKALFFQRACGPLSTPPGLRDLTRLHDHADNAERILSSWLTVKWYPLRCGSSHRISSEVGKSLYPPYAPPCCASGLISP